MATQLDATAPDFAHELHILTPVRRTSGDQWFAYIDEPTRWRRATDSPMGLALAAAEVLRKLLTHERYTREARPDLAGNNPNRTHGTVPDIPSGIDVRWRVEVTASLQETEPEWSVALLDESAWGLQGYNLATILTKLAERIAAAAIEPVEIHSARPPARPQPITDIHRAGSVDFEALTSEALKALDVEIGLRERRILEIETEVNGFLKERRALPAALAAYRKVLPLARKAVS